MNLYQAAVFTLLTLTVSASAQQVKELYPELGWLVDKSPEGEKAFIAKQKRCEEVWNKKRLNGEETLSPAEQELYEDCMLDEEDYWDVIGIGCSWYCGGGPDSVTASSSLKPAGAITYDGANAHDLSYKTAWVEGVSGYGIGEYLWYHFGAGSPRINKIIVINGYVKSEKAWRENSRVKKLKMYLNGKPYAILHLADTKEIQSFAVAPLGNKTAWTFKFEILEVYKGDKYEETALTEIYFDGLDVHCFAAGTLITMSDGTQKPIEHIAKGDSVLTYDTDSHALVADRVSEWISVQHVNLVKLLFEDREITSTVDHPFYTRENLWAAVDAGKSNGLYIHEQQVIPLAVGDYLLMPGSGRYAQLKQIERLEAEQMTYTLALDGEAAFIANGLLVKTELLKPEVSSILSESITR